MDGQTHGDNVYRASIASSGQNLCHLSPEVLLSLQSFPKKVTFVEWTFPSNGKTFPTVILRKDVYKKEVSQNVTQQVPVTYHMLVELYCNWFT